MKIIKQFTTGNISDVYDYIRNSECFKGGDDIETFEIIDLLQWFLANYKNVGEEVVTIWADACYYAGNHAHEEWSIGIARINSPWGRCIKIVEKYYDNAVYSYDSHGYHKETIFMFVEHE